MVVVLFLPGGVNRLIGDKLSWSLKKNMLRLIIHFSEMSKWAISHMQHTTCLYMLSVFIKTFNIEVQVKIYNFCFLFNACKILEKIHNDKLLSIN